MNIWAVVGAVDEFKVGFLDTDNSLNLLQDFLRHCGRGNVEPRCFGRKEKLESSNIKVWRPETFSPGGDAMAFINDDDLQPVIELCR